MIRHLKHFEIDKKNWDKCLNESANDLIYAHSWYLDIVNEGWEALVEDDYKSVMPLTCKKKFGIHYIAQPAFTQQLGIFSRNGVDQETARKFLNAIPSKYKYIQYTFNTGCNFNLPDFSTTINKNYELLLDKPYETIYSLFSSYHHEKIKKASRQNLIIKTITGDQLIPLKRTTLNYLLSDKDLKILRSLGETSVKQEEGKMFGVFNNKDILIAGAFFLFSSNRIIYLFSISGDEGKEKRAMFHLIDFIIRNYSSQPYILDFEGSNMSHLAFFFSGFGATPKNYLSINDNRLPWPLKYFKK